ncbi:putative SBP_bac_5 domain-containing protein [Candidatus Hydrogenisulfobacillus filiaventi]|uniref:Putative SBP_bac_5 domain-containing protein n=1 Tax=Candidatus Hydrogenisulfobacillus filiaventi TaxID=2707344 RepID=A0A6F8ZFW2_9FIRM|nr:putative SBP_bac_5 domain-containing protein [Candidatus Hydrogenisulfobacillus filiaventi]
MTARTAWPWVLLAVSLLPGLLAVRPAAVAPSHPDGGQVTLAVPQPAGSLDPAAAANLAERMTAINVFGTLVRLGPQGQVEPGLARVVQAGPDRLVLSVAPRPLTGGGRLSAALAVEALARTLWPGVRTPATAALLAPLVGSGRVEKGQARYPSGARPVAGHPDLLVLEARRGQAGILLRNLADPRLALVPPADQADGQGYWQREDLFGAGGWRLAAWEPGGSLRFRALDPSAPVQSVTLLPFASWPQGLLAFRNGMVQVLPVPPSRWAGFRPPPGGRLQLARTGTLTWYWNPRGPRTAPLSLQLPEWPRGLLDGRLPSLSRAWPAGLHPLGQGHLDLWVNAADGEAVALARRLARLTRGQVVPVVVPASTLDQGVQAGTVPAYLGRKDRFRRRGPALPVAPAATAWLVAPGLGLRTTDGLPLWSSLHPFLPGGRR